MSRSDSRTRDAGPHEDRKLLSAIRRAVIMGGGVRLVL